MRRSPALLSLILLILGPATAVKSAVINFEEIVASNEPGGVLSDEYADLGAHFVGYDGSIWNGVSDGDPGAFGLDGTNGPSFLGFDGTSFAMALRFDTPVSDFKLDVARGNGGTYHFFLMLQGFRDGELVEIVGAVLGPVGEWKELALTEEVDTVTLVNVGNVRYGVDNLRWDGGMAGPLAVEIDIMPGAEDNPVRIDRPGVVPVVLFGAEDFDVMDVVPESLDFGPDMALLAHRNGPHIKDVDGDGLLDLLAHFPVEEAGLDSTNVMTCLYGELVDGTLFEGCDAITPTGNPMR